MVFEVFEEPCVSEELQQRFKHVGSKKSVFFFQPVEIINFIFIFHFFQ